MKKILSSIIFVLLSLPKTVYFNFAALPFSIAIRLPILIGWKTKIVHAKRGVICFDPSIKINTFMMRIGFGGSETVPASSGGRISIASGKMLLRGRACFAAGSTLDCSGNLTIGRMFSTNKNAFISCSKEITIGNEVMLGWNVNIYDASGHTVYRNGIPHNSQGAITIGDHVWLCSESHLLKGARIGNGSIVAWRSTVTKDLSKDNVLITGSPAFIKQENISWGPYVQ